MKNLNEIQNGLLNSKDVMSFFNISRTTLYKWTMRKKQLPYIRIGGKKLFKIDDLNQLIENNYTSGW